MEGVAIPTGCNPPTVPTLIKTKYSLIVLGDDIYIMMANEGSQQLGSYYDTTKFGYYYDDDVTDNMGRVSTTVMYLLVAA